MSSVDPAVEDLRRELDAEPPEEIAALGDPELIALTNMLRASSERQSMALRSAIDDGMRFLPRILRGAVRRALFG